MKTPFIFFLNMCGILFLVHENLMQWVQLPDIKILWRMYVFNCYECPMLRVLILNIIVEKNDVYSLSHFSVCSAKVKSLICRKCTCLLEKIEMEQPVATSVVRPRVSKWPYLNAIYVAKHHLWHQRWRNSWQWQLGLRTLNYSLDSSIKKVNHSTLLISTVRKMPFSSLSIFCIADTVFQISTKRYHSMTLDWISCWSFCCSLYEWLVYLFFLSESSP